MSGWVAVDGGWERDCGDVIACARRPDGVAAGVWSVTLREPATPADPAPLTDPGPLLPGPPDIARGVAMDLIRRWRGGR